MYVSWILWCLFQLTPFCGKLEENIWNLTTCTTIFCGSIHSSGSLGLWLGVKVNYLPSIFHITGTTWTFVRISIGTICQPQSRQLQIQCSEWTRIPPIFPTTDQVRDAYLFMKRWFIAVTPSLNTAEKSKATQEVANTSSSVFAPLSQKSKNSYLVWHRDEGSCQAW